MAVPNDSVVSAADASPPAGGDGFDVGPAPDAGPSVLHDCADAFAYVASVCFKHGPPTLTGVELEWLARGPATGPDGRAGSPSRAALRSALGPHCPTSLDAASPALPLPGGSTVTVEPGGQLELASPPFPRLPDLLEATLADADVLLGLAAAGGLTVERRAASSVPAPVRLLDLPRYVAMEQAFDRIGPDGRSAMCSTAAVQVSVDAGQGADVARRWALTHAVGPVLLAAFANSPFLLGRRTGWKSARWAAWANADPARTAPPSGAAVDTADPAGAWAARVLDAPVLCVRRAGTWLVPRGVSFADWVRGALPGRPTTDDLSYHISTIFPPVRPRGHLEIRYVDMQPGRRWALPAAVLMALLSDPAVGDLAREACEPTLDRWWPAARVGLEDAVLARAARRVFTLALQQLPALCPPEWLTAELTALTEQRVFRGLCPADPDEGAR